jgi:Holliday junction DNA helicase RuvB
MEGIDTKGLDSLDRKLLTTTIEYYSGGPVGVEALAATVNEEVDTLEEMVEPYLLKIGFIKRTKRGRVVGNPAYEHLNIKPDKGNQQSLF